MKSYLEAFKRELLSLNKYKGLYVLLFIGPLFLTLYFGGVYYNDYVKDIPIAILDEDNSSMSHLMGNYFLSNERFIITEYPGSRDELKTLIDNSDVQMGLIIPQGFERNATTYQSSQILAILDGTNIVVSNNALAQATSIVQTISAGVEMKLIQGKGVSPQMAENIALVYNVGERMLFDPKMTYMNYLIICFLAVFVQQLLMAAMGSTFIRDQVYLSEGHVLLKAVGANHAFLLAIMPAVVICMIILTTLFKVKMVGSLMLVLVMTVVFALALTGPALIFASLTKDRVKYSQFSFMLSLPTFVTSGCMWPVDQMPKYLEVLVRMFWPLINYAKSVQEILIKGLEFKTVIPNLLQMGLFTLVWLPIGVLCYKKAFASDGLTLQSKRLNRVLRLVKN